MTETIWRVEDEYGQGVYRSHLPEFERMYNKHSSNDNKYPQPSSDKGIEREPTIFEICGFKDLKQAKKWFSTYEINRMKQYGFELKKVEVARITAVGECQVLAIRGI